MKIVVPYPPGGASDNYARLVAGELTKRLSQPVTVENQPGGSGAVALRTALRADPDGRTLLSGQPGEIVLQPPFFRQAGPRPVPVALVANFPLAVVVRTSAPWTRVSDLIGAARSAPRALTIASPGRLTPADVALEVFRPRIGGRASTVQFDGGGPALEAVANGQVDVFFATLSAAMPYVRDGGLKVLAVNSMERLPALPDVPTLRENGISDIAVTQWSGIFAPRGTPAGIIEKLNSEINQILVQPDVGQKIVQDSGKVTTLSPTQFADFIRSDSVRVRDFAMGALCSEYVVEGCEGLGMFMQ